MSINIRRNSRKKLAAYAERVKSIRCYSLSNCFTAQDCTENMIKSYGSVAAIFEKDLTNDRMKRTKLTVNEDDTNLVLHIHSNLWYEFSLDKA